MVIPGNPGSIRAWKKARRRLHGTGVFATEPIRAGERLLIVGGTVFTTAERDAGLVQLNPDKAYNAGNWTKTYGS